MQGNIECFEEAFDPKYCRWLLDDARTSLTSSRAFSRSNFSWDANVVRASQTVLIRDYDKMQADFILGCLRERHLVGNEEYSVMCFAWTRLSYIPWHNDGTYKSAITIYLNEEWDPDWGGIFLYRAGEEIKGFAPRFNNGIRNNSNLEHAVTLVSVEAPEPRFTLQLFSPPSKASKREAV